jgi:hypothetical protein
LFCFPFISFSPCVFFLFSIVATPKFGHYQTVGVCWMATKNIHSPFDTLTLSIGDWIFWSPRKGGMSHAFGKLLTRTFQKDATNKPFVAIENF